MEIDEHTESLVINLLLKKTRQRDIIIHSGITINQFYYILNENNLTYDKNVYKEDKINLVKKLISEKNYTTKDLANHFGISYNTVIYFLHNNNITPSKKKTDPISVLNFYKEYNTYTFKPVGDHFGITTERARQIIRAEIPGSKDYIKKYSKIKKDIIIKIKSSDLSANFLNQICGEYSGFDKYQLRTKFNFTIKGEFFYHRNKLICKQIKKHIPFESIQKEFTLSKRNILDIAHSGNIWFRGNKNIISKRRAEIKQEHFNNGKSVIELAKKFKVSTQTVRNSLRAPL